MYDEISSSYLSYAMSVIVSRALPDVRDGLKPVHRRILFAMYKGGYDWSKQFRKSARIVGDVIGKYHPHGDQSVYDALVRMVQDFSMSLPLIDGQVNFGSIDGDPPAAMRYTETKLAKVSQFLIDDIDIKDIAEYNLTEGLALSDDEVKYLNDLSKTLGRFLTDSEVFGFSQVNSEHCRHKIFNGKFVINGKPKGNSLFELIKKTSKKNPNNIVSAYKDNVAFIEGPEIEQIVPKDATTPSNFSK